MFPSLQNTELILFCLLTEADLCVFVGVDADSAERPSLSGDGHHRQGNGEEIRQVLQEDDHPVFTERSRKKVSS